MWLLQLVELTQLQQYIIYFGFYLLYYFYNLLYFLFYYYSEPNYNKYKNIFY